MFRRLSSRTLILNTLPCLALCLAGCITTPYGVVAGSNSNDGTTIVMPAGAPSIFRGFNGNTRGDAPNAHVGLDVVATVGAPVLAVAPGEVTAVSGNLLSGRRIVIDHGKDRSGTGYSTRYFHLDSQLVKIGDQVKRGQIIGRVGATGLLAPYPHLHFELHRGDGFGQAVNPHEYWLDGPGRVTCFVPNTSVQASQFRMIYPVKCMTADKTN